MINNWRTLFLSHYTNKNIPNQYQWLNTHHMYHTQTCSGIISRSIIRRAVQYGKDMGNNMPHIARVGS